MEKGTLIPRGMYIRKCDSGIYNRQHFAKLADKERDLRLALGEPKNWLSQYFSKEPSREELKEFFDELVLKLHHAGYETVPLEDWVHDEIRQS